MIIRLVIIGATFLTLTGCQFFSANENRLTTSEWIVMGTPSDTINNNAWETVVGYLKSNGYALDVRDPSIERGFLMTHWKEHNGELMRITFDLAKTKDCFYYRTEIYDLGKDKNSTLESSEECLDDTLSTLKFILRKK